MGRLWRRAPQIALRFIPSSSQYGHARTVQQTPQSALARCCSVIATPITAFDVSLLPQRDLHISMENSVFASGLDLTSHLALRLPVICCLGDWQYAQALRSSPAGKRGRAPSVLCIRLTPVQRARLPPHKLETGSRHTSTAPP